MIPILRQNDGAEGGIHTPPGPKRNKRYLSLRLLRNIWYAKDKIFLFNSIEIFRDLLVNFQESFVDFQKAFHIEILDGLHVGVEILRLGEKDDGAHGVPPFEKKYRGRALVTEELNSRRHVQTDAMRCSPARGAREQSHLCG
jgi:hypothetical protein